MGPVGAGAFKATYHTIAADGSAKALKIYSGSSRSARVEREIEAMKLCDHTNIAHFDTVATTTIDSEEYLYSLEEYVPGETLESRLRSSLLPIDDAIRLGSLLVVAIRHIAEHQLVHRDIKPANIIIHEDGYPVLVDFGLVRNLDATSLTATWLPHGPGTPYYAPPEQLNNWKDLIDWRADQFSLGVVLVTAMTGVHPYARSGDSPEDVVDRVSNSEGYTESFATWAGDNGLGMLTTMVEPWPVRRFRVPAELVGAWESLGNE